MLAQAGLTREEVRTLSTELHLHERSIVTGEVTALVTVEPVKSRLLRAGYRVIFDSSAMSGEILDVLVVRRDLPPVREATLREAWQRGLAALQAGEPKMLATLARGAGLEPEEYVSALEGLRFFPPDEAAALLTPATMARRHAELIHHLLASRLLRDPPDWQSLLPAPTAPTR
jgi:NitT/TauT family transport system substrate-binding protein